MSKIDSCCIVVPVKDQADALRGCLENLCLALIEDATVVVVDDGSATSLVKLPHLGKFYDNRKFHFLRHPEARGAGAARDTGIAWARKNGFGLVILLDADCLVGPDFVVRHAELHRRHPSAACCGGAITGVGRGLWAWLDGVMSWFTSLPEAPERLIHPPYHLPSTNMSLKLNAFPEGALFDHHLRTGEDVTFSVSIRSRGLPIVFSPQPHIRHLDRETFSGFMRHQYDWGLHTYAVRMSRARMDLASRLSFAILFALASPAYVVLATTLNIIPWRRRSWLYLALSPVLAFFYAIKAIAVIEGALRPKRVLRTNEKAKTDPE